MILNDNFLTKEQSSKTIDKNAHIKSFALRQGRITKGQLQAINDYWSLYGLNYANEMLHLPEIFSNYNKLVLDIGFGSGDSLVVAAQNNPDINFIGIEVNKSCVGLALKKIHQARLKNVKILNYDAVLVLKNMMPANSLAAIQIFFADPWHKARHNKRRLLQASFVELISEKMLKNSYFHFATDWFEYKDHVLGLLDNYPEFKLEGFFKNAETRPRGRPLTKFEQRGIDLNYDIWDMVYRFDG